MASSSLSDKALFQTIRDLMAPVADVVGDEWHTVNRFAKEHGVSERNAQRMLVNALQNGVVERAMFRVQTTSGVRPVPHYRAL